MADNGDISAHENTYHGFMQMMKWGTVVCALVGLGVVVLIAQ